MATKQRRQRVKAGDVVTLLLTCKACHQVWSVSGPCTGPDSIRLDMHGALPGEPGDPTLCPRCGGDRSTYIVL